MTKSEALDALVAESQAMGAYDAEGADREAELMAALIKLEAAASFAGIPDRAEHKAVGEALEIARAALAASPAGAAELPEPAAWVTPLRYGSQVTFYKPPKPERWDDDDSAGEWFCRPLYAALLGARKVGDDCVSPGAETGGA